MTQHITSKSNTKELYANIGKRLKQIRLKDTLKKNFPK